MPVHHLLRARPAFRRLLTGVLLLTVAGLLPGTGAAPARADNPSLWEAWTSEAISLESKESFQMLVHFQDIPVRRWKLVVDGGNQRCDLSLLRGDSEELLYFKTNESLHEFSVPWGKGEELQVVITNADKPASFVITLFGPPRDQVTAAYSYHVNRALEAYGTGQRLEAEDQCRLALRDDPDDGVAKVLLAGFQRDRNAYDSASSLVEEALSGELPPEMRSLAENMRAELVKLRSPLPAPVRRGLAQAEALLNDGEAQGALAVCDKLLAGKLELEGSSQSRILTLKGQALEALDLDFEAVDAYTRALSFDRSRDNQAIIHFHMGRLFDAMDNLTQARGALTIALQYGLPGGFDLQARELLQEIENKLAHQR